MPPNIIQKLKELIEPAVKVLIIFPGNFNGDLLGSALALSDFLKKMGKEIEIVSPGFEKPVQYSFLPRIDQIKKDLLLLKDLIISVDLKNNEIGEVSYEVQQEKLNVYLAPKKRLISKDDISLSSAEYNYDLIIVLGCKTIEDLGAIYQNYADFFQKASLINIDYRSENNNFGQLNIVDVNSASVSEVVYKIIRNLKQDLIDADIATFLLTGIISMTNVFRSSQTSQHTLLAASQLISLGANKKMIIKNLYQEKSVAFLKLWGRVLARLSGANENKIAWSLITSEDFIKVGVSASDLIEQKDKTFWDIIQELNNSLLQAEIVAVFWQKATEIIVYIQNRNKNLNLLNLVADFSPQGTEEKVKIVLSGNDLKQAEEMIIKEIKNRIGG